MDSQCLDACISKHSVMIGISADCFFLSYFRFLFPILILVTDNTEYVRKAFSVSIFLCKHFHTIIIMRLGKLASLLKWVILNSKLIIYVIIMHSKIIGENGSLS